MRPAAHPGAAAAGGWADVLAAPWPGPGPWWITVPAPVTSGAAALPDDAEPVVALAPTEGPAWVGWGEARRVQARGPGRLSEAAEAVQASLTDLTAVGAGPAPVMLGGFGFEDEPAGGWAPLDALTFVLPRLAYVVEGPRAWLCMFTPDASPDGREAAALALGAARARLEAGRVPAGPAVSLGPEPADARPRWAAGIAAAQAAMAAGRVDKVVLSRRIPLRAAGPVRPAGLWQALLAAPAGATRFMFQRAGHTFFGLTPERLVSKAGCEVRTDALAGSAAVGDELRLTDAKEREEHDLVVRYIAARLTPRVEALEVPAAPQHRRLSYVTHLWTPIRARVAPGASVLGLAEALHPTPAVGGTPLETAQAILREAEAGPRGWYAGGVGWVDGAGDGALFVALRSALLTPEGGAAFVGAGIVRGSDPEREWAETQLKATAVLRALGLEQAPDGGA